MSCSGQAGHLLFLPKRCKFAARYTSTSCSACLSKYTFVTHSHYSSTHRRFVTFIKRNILLPNMSKHLACTKQ
jgi:hypothetical protein